MTTTHQKIQIRSLLNKLADQYEQLVYTQPTDPTSILKRYKQVFETLELRPQLKILELGAGTGVFTLPVALTQSKAQVSALDIADRMLENLNDKLNRQTVHNVNVVLGDYNFLPFVPDTFDRVFYSFSIQDSLQPMVTLSEATRVLRYGGKLVVLGIGAGHEKVGDTRLDSIARDSYPPHIHYYDQEEIVAFLKECRLTNVTTFIVYMDRWLIKNVEVIVPLYVVSGSKW